MATVAAERPQAPPGRPGRYKWIALSNTTIGALLASMNSSILLIALPSIFIIVAAAQSRRDAAAAARPA